MLPSEWGKGREGIILRLLNNHVGAHTKSSDWRWKGKKKPNQTSATTMKVNKKRRNSIKHRDQMYLIRPAIRSCEYMIFTIRANMRIFGEKCEYFWCNLENVIWRSYTQILLHFRVYVHCFSMQEAAYVINDLDSQEWIQAQAKLTKRQKILFLGVRTPATTWKCDIWYSCEY